MLRKTLTGLTLGLATLAGPSAPAQTGDRDAAKRETVRGVIAGVTVEGETAIDFVTRRAQVVEVSYLTVIGSPVTSSTQARTGQSQGQGRNQAGDQGSQGRSRHNVYIVFLTPQTQIRDASSSGSGQGQAQGQAQAAPTTFDKIEVGDRVEVTFVRRDLSATGGDDGHAQKARRHGRHRTAFGDAVSITILAPPDRGGGHDRTPRSDQDRDRDDDKDKVKGQPRNR